MITIYVSGSILSYIAVVEAKGRMGLNVRFVYSVNICQTLFLYTVKILKNGYILAEREHYTIYIDHWIRN